METIHVSKIHFTSKPDCSKRLAKEERVYDYLDKLQIPYEGVDHDVANTIEDCREIEKELQIGVCKNLFLCNRQKTTFFLLMMPGDKHFETKVLSHQLGVSRLSFAESQYMEEFLDITPGSVSVLGLMNDVEEQVDLLVDGDLLKEEFLGCHPCINTSSLKLRTSDILQKFVKATGHSYHIVTL
ncbi:MAG: prolyl-tRNA synthetase associated domain-containing protein [Bariatricus sp.]